MKYLAYSIVFLLMFLTAAFAQVKPLSKPLAQPNAVKQSPAFGEVLLRKVEIEAELEEMRAEFTDEYPKVKELKVSLELIEKEKEKLLKLDASQAGKLSAALGKLIIKKVEAEVEMQMLLEEQTEKHPDVVAKKKKLQVFEKAIKEIMQ